MAIQGDRDFKTQTLGIFLEVSLQNDFDLPLDLETLSLFNFFLTTPLSGDRDLAAMCKAVIFFVTTSDAAVDLQIVKESDLLRSFLRFKNLEVVMCCFFIVRHLVKNQAHDFLRYLVDLELIPYLIHAFEDHQAFEDSVLFDLLFSCLLDLVMSHEDYLPILQRAPCQSMRSRCVQEYLIDESQQRLEKENKKRKLEE
jgi:hypothetical protein